MTLTASAPTADPTVAPALVAGRGLRAWQAALLVFSASCASLVLQLVAGRLLAPYIGVSLYTWTSIIGVFLAGISLGSWIGGRVADRSPSGRTLALLFLFGAAATFGSLGLLLLLGDGAAWRTVPLLVRIFVLTVLLGLPASFLLGMVTPLVIKLLLPDVTRTGRVVGLVYAVGTVGSVVGNFLTGFVLVAWLDTWTTVAAVGVALLLTAGLAWLWGDAVAVPKADDDRPLAAAPAHAVARRGPLLLTGNMGLACLVVVVGSFCTMAMELAASRVLAPHVGVSLYSWTGIIGVVLVGIALGNYLGGRIADRWPRQGVLGGALFLSGLAALSILVAVQVATTYPPIFGLGLMERIVALTAALFLLPVVLLGTISPQVIRLTITDLAHAGRVAGRIYAWSTAGAIAGTFATGWWLIERLGVNTVILVAGLGLLGLAVLVGRFWANLFALGGAAAATVAALAILGARGALASPCTMETGYFCIKVIDQFRDAEPVRALVLDHLIHSYVKPGDPSYLGYEHEQVQAEMTRLVAARTPRPDVLLIGGGGYTYPRWVDAYVPAASVEVVEIDPGVTEVVHRELGLPRDTRIVSHNLDGRQFVHELAPRRHYELVVQDAVNDLSVPYHILTKEYNDLVREVLTEDGIYLLTVIDLYEDGQLLRAAIRTLQQTFPSVQLLGPGPVWEGGGASVFVVYAANRPFDRNALASALRGQGIDRVSTTVLPDERLRAYVATGPQVVLADRYAPVDNLIIPLFRRRA